MDSIGHNGGPELWEIDLVGECQTKAEYLVAKAPGRRKRDRLRAASRLSGVDLKNLIYRASDVKLSTFAKVLKAYAKARARAEDAVLQERAIDAVIAGEYRNLSEALLALRQREEAN